jgi:putative peptide zinc metalloprotease protein
VAQLTDQVLDARVALLQSQLREVELRLTAAEATDRVQAQMLRQQRGYFQSQLDEMRGRRAALAVAAPADGRLLLAAPGDLDGKYFKRGELIGYILDNDAALVRVIVPQSDIELVRENTTGVDLRFASAPMRALRVGEITREVPTATRQLPSVALASFGGGPIAVDPADEKHLRALEMVFQMDVPLPKGAGEHRIGERVYVRFEHGDQTLAWRIERSARQLFLRRFDL